MKMDKDWLFTTEDYICDLRTAGVLLRNGKILLQREQHGNEYALPGGHVKIGETTEECLIREYKEETGVNISFKKLLWSEECFWEWNGKKAHNITFYYLIELCNDSGFPDTGEFIPHKDNKKVLIGWIPIESLSEITVYPEFLKTEIQNIDSSPKHFISK